MHSPKEGKKLKIAFYPMGQTSWVGGGIYLETLFQALKQTNGAGLSIGIVGENGFLSDHSQIRELVDDVISYPSVRRWTSTWARESVSLRLRRRGVVRDQVLRRHHVDAIAFGEAPEGSKIPALAWIPDFQHRHLPEFFSAEERRNRDVSFSRLAERAARVILLSESVKKDFAAFHPRFADKARVLQPISAIPPSVYDDDPVLLCQHYNLPAKFFYLPNQFWKHKNHITVFRAVKILKDRGIPVFVACSGHLDDYRHPAFFSELLQEISRLNIREQVALLGVVPREHVFQLMRQSISVLNPSLFEGYGMTVDEARSFGKQILISDIAPHREQNPPRAVFFNKLDSEGLAEHMNRVWREIAPGPNAQIEAASESEMPERMRNYAELFVAIVREVLV
jgi:glycosyltransferase involved in cell wall biosynthesis